MGIYITNHVRWHHPLRIAKNHIKKYLAFLGLVVLIAGTAYFVGHWRA